MSLTLQRVSASTPDGRVLFSDLTFTQAAERTGLVGANGVGKSTLLSLIAGLQQPASGTITGRGRIGWLRQRPEDPALRLEELLVHPAREPWDLEGDRHRALAEVGMAGAPLDRPLGSFSGGEQTRLALAALMVAEPDLVLMDEPTNNLDTQGMALVARFLRRWTGGLIVASHDPALLEAVDRILWLSPTGCRLIGGNGSDWEALRAAEEERTRLELERAEAAVRRTERAVQLTVEKRDRRARTGRHERARGSNSAMLMDFRKGRAEQTAGRDAALAARLREQAKESLTSARQAVDIRVPLQVDLPTCDLPDGRTVLEAEGLGASRGGRLLFGSLDLTITGPERVAITGPNGAGKTTLLTILDGRSRPDSGTVRRITPARTLLDQHVGLPPEATSVLEAFRLSHPALSDNEARAALARFGFRNRAAEASLASLSGGERVRAGLACAFAGRVAPELVILDEPTNHLDRDARASLIASLQAYDGAVLAVSHDADFLAGIGVERTIRLG